jgi:hypothetical protein
VNASAPVRTGLRLLARVHFRDATDCERESLASILELGPRGARIESARQLEKGCLLELRVVFPGQRKYASRHVKLRYVVRGPHDEPNLHYDLDAADMDGETRERLALYLSRVSPES